MGMVHYKIINLLSQSDTFNLIFNEETLSVILNNLSNFDSLCQLENEIKQILIRAMTETSSLKENSNAGITSMGNDCVKNSNNDEQMIENQSEISQQGNQQPIIYSQDEDKENKNSLEVNQIATSDRPTEKVAHLTTGERAQFRKPPFTNSLIFLEAQRLLTLTTTLFEQARIYECSFKPDYTDGVVRDYCRSLGAFAEGVSDV